MTTGPTPFGPSSPRSPSSRHSGSSCGPSSEPTAASEKHTPRSSNNSARNETNHANSHRQTTSEGSQISYLNAGNACRKQIPAGVSGERPVTCNASSPETIVFGGSPGTTSTAKSRMIESWRLSCFISLVAPAGLRLAVVFLRRYEKQATTNRRFTTDSSGRRRTRAQSRSRAPPRSPWMATISFRGRGEAMTSPAVFTAPLLGWPGCQRLNRFERRSPLMATDEDVACTCCGRHLPRKKLHSLGDDRAFICRRCGWWVALRLHRDRPPA